MLSSKQFSPPVKLEGFNPDGQHNSAFIKDFASFQFSRVNPPGTVAFTLVQPEANRRVPSEFHLQIRYQDRVIAQIPRKDAGECVKHFELNPGAEPPFRFELSLQGGLEYDNWKGGIYKFLSKLISVPTWSNYWTRRRRNRLNRLIRVRRVDIDGEELFDFSNPHRLINPLFDLEARRVGMNIIGWFRGTLGIGESARSSFRACAAVDLPHQLVDLKTPCLADLSDDSVEEHLTEDNPFGINLFHINPPESHDLEHHYGGAFFENRYNIAYWAWELPEFPDDWVTACRYYDEIWCPSRFVADSIAQKAPLPVVVMPHSVQPTLAEKNWRSHFQLPADRVVFLFAFDFNSYLERKNPLGVVEAFRRAFNGEHNASLVLKHHSGTLHPGDYARLRQAIGDTAHVHEIPSSLSRDELTGLQSACDVFVSLHRSEGFGLNLAECMALGKPVIATDWSGSAEFLNAGNGCPVRCRLTRLADTHGPYEAGQWWAEPDLDDAAAAMRRLADDPVLREQLGERARQTIRDHFAPEVIGNRYRQRIRWIQTWSALAAGGEDNG